jgi:hypothetical protein
LDSVLGGDTETATQAWLVSASEHAAVDVLMDDGRSELFWLPDLSVVDEDIAI